MFLFFLKAIIVCFGILHVQLFFLKLVHPLFVLEIKPDFSKQLGYNL